MRQPHGRVSLVYVLPSRSRGPVGVDPEIFRIDLDRFDIDLWNDVNARKSRVSSSLGIEWANPHETVRPSLGLEGAVGVVSLDGDGRRLDASLLTAFTLFRSFSKLQLTEQVS